MKSSLKVGDIAVITAVFLTAVILFICISLPRNDNGKALIIKNNGTESSYSLSEENEFKLSGNTYTLTVKIKNGSAYVKEADCPDNTCVHSGKISNAGRVIACVPAGITLSVTEEEASYDFIAG